MRELAEIVNGVLFLASEEASFITAEHLVNEGGATLVEIRRIS